MSVASIHKPVQQELEQVEKAISDVTRSEIPEVQKMLQMVL